MNITVLQTTWIQAQYWLHQTGWLHRIRCRSVCRKHHAR